MVGRLSQVGDVGPEPGMRTVGVTLGHGLSLSQRRTAVAAFGHCGLTARRAGARSPFGYIVTGTRAQFQAWEAMYHQFPHPLETPNPSYAFDATDTAPSRSVAPPPVLTPRCPWCGKKPKRIHTAAQYAPCLNLSCPAPVGYWNPFISAEANLVEHGPALTPRSADVPEA